MPYLLINHTADARMKVRGKTLNHLFSEAVRGMMAIAKPTIQEGRKPVKRDVVVEAGDRSALLVDFLNEALRLSHSYKEAYKDIRYTHLSDQNLQATLTGIPIVFFGRDIKAVTYHEVDVKKNEKGEWETLIVFDI